MEDVGNGTYRLLVTPCAPGQWEVLPTLGGNPCTAAAIDLHASHRPLHAGDLVIKAPKNQGTARVCGVTETVTVVPVVATRCVAGDEHVTAVQTGLSGMAVPVPVRVMDDGGGFALQATWREAGANSLAVYVDGVHVGGSPLLVDAEPGPPAPAACSVRDVGLVDGELSLTVAANDALHNACALADDSVALVATPPACLADVKMQRIAQDVMTLTATVKGPGRFNVTVNDQALLAVDRVLPISEDAPSLEPALRLLHGPVVQAVAGRLCSVAVVLDNVVGRLSMVPSAMLTTHEREQQVTVNTRGDGRFEAQFTIAQAVRCTCIPV